jgi:hypothetical protein
LLVVAAALSACATYYPAPILGLADAGSWQSLPLRRWLAEDRAEPEALAICRPPECGPGMAVVVVLTRGRDADRAEAVLKQPEALARALEDMRDRKRRNAKAPVRTVAAVERLRSQDLQGFLLFLDREDGARPAYGAALGRRTRDGLRVVLAIGESREAVQATAVRVAAEHLGS